MRLLRFQPQWRIAWWQRVLLWPLPTRVVYDAHEGVALCYKVWRGTIYVMSEEPL
jgi:hypothetical protein